MMKKRWKRGGALLLALALALSGTGILKTRAAVAVDTTKKCSLEVNAQELYLLINGEYKKLNGDEYPEDVYEDDLGNMQKQVLTINLYKIADITASGKYNVDEDSEFAGLKHDIENVNDETSAKVWNTIAESAKSLVDKTEAIPGSINYPEDNTYSCTIENLDTGLYLIVPESVKTAYYEYTFSPYLISLPNNYYHSSGDDAWKYDLTGDLAVGLKPEQTPLYGDLNIVKTLADMNTTFGSSATFVYQIDITTLKGERETRIEAIEFTGAGTNTLTVSNIEAGSRVTVTEVYSGAGYQISGSDTARAVIAADGLEGAPAQVEFTNVPDNTMTGGYGAINHFVQNADGTDYTHSRLDGGAVNAPAE